MVTTAVCYNKSMNILTDARLAWLAALIDGEGSVMLIKRVPSATAKTQRNPHYRAVVGIYNTDVRLMDAIVEHTGINRVYSHTRLERENHKKTAYSWRMVAEDIRTLGPLLLPWLVCKKEQMALLLEALELASLNTPRKGEKLVRQPTTRRDEIAVAISELNRKGRFTITEVSE